MKAKCLMPVQVYDEGLTGCYAAGQVVEGEQARRLLDRYPEYFEVVPNGKKEGKA